MYEKFLNTVYFPVYFGWDYKVSAIVVGVFLINLSICMVYCIENECFLFRFEEIVENLAMSFMLRV